MAVTELNARANNAVDDLYRRHVGDVYRFTYAVLGNHADAEDVTQTTFVNALRALERGETPRDPSSWLLAIAHNVVRQRWRQAAARPSVVELDADVPDSSGDAADDVELTELVRALQRIPETQREAIVMRELEGRSYREIAELLGLTTSALETLLFRARRSLADELENVVTCQSAEVAISKRADGRLSRKERRRLDEHLAECDPCARLAATQKRQRRAFKGLALLPLPIGLSLFKGAQSAAAATTLPTIGLGTSGQGGSGAVSATGAGGASTGTAVGGSLATGVAAKIAAAVVVAVIAAGGAYKGAEAMLDSAPTRVPTPSGPATAPVVRDELRPPAPVSAQPTVSQRPTHGGKTHATHPAAPAGTKNATPKLESPPKAVTTVEPSSPKASSPSTVSSAGASTSPKPAATAPSRPPKQAAPAPKRATPAPMPRSGERRAGPPPKSSPPRGAPAPRTTPRPAAPSPPVSSPPSDGSPPPPPGSPSTPPTAPPPPVSTPPSDGAPPTPPGDSTPQPGDPSTPAPPPDPSNPPTSPPTTGDPGKPGANPWERGEKRGHHKGNHDGKHPGDD